VVGFKLGEWYENGTLQNFIEEIKKDDDEKEKK